MAYHAQSLKSATAVNPELERWRSYSGVSWDRPDHSGAAKAFSNSVSSPICGIHFDKRGRAFVSTPRLVSSESPATISVLDLNSLSGPAILTAFPSVEGNTVSANPDQNLRSVLGFYVDRTNDWLWALDMGYIAGETEAPAGAQKVLVFDLETGSLVKRIGLDIACDRKGSFLNDIVVDEQRKIGYISDSGIRSAPDNMVGIIVIDVASGSARRVLHKHASLQVVPGVKVFSHNNEVWPGNPMKCGINGIALSPDANTLYWTVTTGFHAYSISTQLLRDPSAPDEEISAAVRNIGSVGGNSDGIVTDAEGNLYITDLTHGGIVKYDSQKHTMTLVASDAGVWWPDTPTIDHEGNLVFSSSNLSQHFAGGIKPGQERYELWRLILNSR
ncbi:SMP-30/gluconolactonase/LRE family protein [Alloacidobacterium dinghuense]|uniref:SMP-30/gluconolactonase/LRE family protein n=1 Tax=Alloacidobacterium dinghuense TaxID=2763107 RepID=A0A7G8BGJ3_9BACT|nr:SMP-30/gluconolactonase/LRE family protein [Alloacidobacterium dinghuense]